MALIAQLKLNPETGTYTGKIRTLTVSGNVTVKFEDNGGDDNLPSYRVYIGKFEAGAGWNKIGETSGNHYIGIRIEDPFIPNVVYMNLIKTADQDTGEEKHLLLWSRPDDE